MRAATQERSPFHFPSNIPDKTRERQIQEEAILLWRVLQRQPEIQDGSVKVMKDPFIKAFVKQYSDFLEPGHLTGALSSILTSNSRYHIRFFNEFVDRVAASYNREMAIKRDRRNRFSFDILFQTIEMLSMHKNTASAEETIDRLGQRENLSISKEDREQLMQSFRAYLEMNRRIMARKKIRSVLVERDEIIGETARALPAVSLIVLDSMFRNIIAQYLLSRKYQCSALIVEWAKEYSLEPTCIVRIADFIPMDTTFSRFREQYVRAVQSLKTHVTIKEKLFESDIFLLRSLANFYTSWIMRVAEQIPV